MPDKTNDTVIATVMEQLMAEGPQAMAPIVTALMNLAMRMEREQFLGAGHYERAVDRRGYANGTKPELIDTLAGTLSLEVPKTAGTDEPYYPQELAQCPLCGPTLVPRRHAGRGRDVCVRCLDPRCRAGHGRVRFEELIIDPQQLGPKSAAPPNCSMTSWKPGVAERSAKFATSSWTPAHEKSRHGGVVRDAAVLSAFGVGPDGRRRILGVSVALSEAEIHWRAFLEELVARGMRGVRFITSDDHASLEAGRKAVLGGAVPPRSADRVPFGSRMNGLLAIHGRALPVPLGAERHPSRTDSGNSKTPRHQSGGQLREIWNAKNLAGAEAELKALVEAYRDNAPELAAWLEVAIPEGLAVFTLPEHHRKRMRTSNPIERAVQQELKRRTAKVRVFPNNASLLRLVTAVLVEIDETRQASTQPYINWNTPDA